MADPRILIIDDEKSVRILISRSLQLEGYLIEGATNGEEALKMIKQFNPNIVLLDIKMPGIPGNELIKMIKELLPEVEIIMITAVEMGAIYVECSFKGAFQVVTKPIDFEKLKITIKNALEHQRKKLR